MTDVVQAPRASSSVHEEMNRFEVKYLVATRLVPDLLAEFADYTVNDPYDHGNGYHVHSVYWDTSDFRFFWEKIEGFKFRRKLRLRRYDRTAPVMVEVKQREDRTVQKRRVVWSIDEVKAAFGEGHGVNWSLVETDTVATEVALLIDRLRLRPMMAISYRRRALFGRFDRELRVTFDGRIQYHPTRLDIADIFDTGRYALDPRATVLEIKYNHRAPVWLTKAVARRGLQMVRMSKYCNAVDRYYYDGMNTW